MCVSLLGEETGGGVVGGRREGSAVFGATTGVDTHPIKIVHHSWEFP